MITLLLLLLLMPKDVIEYKTIDYVKPVVQTDPWLSSPMLDSRVQTNNRYLDSVIGNNVTEIASWWDKVLDSFTVSLVGRYKRGWTNWIINIPTQWTYLINIDSSFVWLVGIYTLNILKNGTQVYSRYVTNWTDIDPYPLTIDITKTFNLNKWDYIQIQLWQSNSLWDNITFETNVSVIKLS